MEKTMNTIKNIQRRPAVYAGTADTVHVTTSAAEVMALSMVAAVAVTSATIGAWSILAFAGALATNGPTALVSGLMGTVTGF